MKLPIKEKLKFFGLSFFSDKIVATAPLCGFGTLFFGLVLAVVFFLCGYMGADVAPFSTHLGNASAYREFIGGAFGSGLEIEIAEGAAESGARINTYTSADDAEKYVKNGYNLIVDTRPADTLIEFTQVAEKNGSEIGYEEYLKLSESEREGYKIKTVCTDNELELNNEKIALFEAYLGGNEKASEEYKRLKEANYSPDEYAKQLYFLYCKHYYKNATSMLYGASVPVLRDYYYNNYITNGKAHYFYVFGDLCAGSFETDGKISVVFGGYYRTCKNQIVNGDNIEDFIAEAYYGTAGYSFTSYAVSAISLLPVLIFITLILAFVMWGVGKAVKGGWTETFSGCLKTLSGFIWASALIVATIAFICGFFAPSRLMHALLTPIFALILVIRATIFCIRSAIKNKKQPVTIEETEQIDNIDDVFGKDI